MKRRIKLPTLEIAAPGATVSAMGRVPLHLPGGDSGPWQKTMAGLKEAFDLKLGAVEESDGVLRRFEDEAQELEIFEASDSWRWTRLPRPEALPEGPAKVPDDPIAAANAFLKAHGLFDERAEAVSVGSTSLASASADAESGFPVETHVHYRFSLGGLPLIGPGAKMRVTFGPDGEVSSAYKFWREPSDDPPPAPSPFRRLMRPEEARKRLSLDPLWAGLPRGTRVSVKRVYLAYYAAPPSVTQETLLPVFAYEGTLRLRDRPSYPFVHMLEAVRVRADEWRATSELVRSLVRR
jgi:hypothetical protein